MLAGHNYSRAVRAHTILLASLSNIVFNQIDFTSDETDFMDSYLVNFHDTKPEFTEVEGLKILTDVKLKFLNK